MEADKYTPALGWHALTGLYDSALALLTREHRWRAALLEQVAAQPGETIVDVGCGTGTLAIALKRRAPEAHIIGIDPDPRALKLAAEKADRAGVSIDWRQGMASALSAQPQTVDKAVSSLVFHQVPPAGKRAGIAAMAAALRSGGELHIADYARQTGLARLAFRCTVQLLDGIADTQPNADGMLESILAEVAGAAVNASCAFGTPTGTIKLFKVTPAFHADRQ
ncbi:MAG: hypothetical protein BGP17_02535 [Sphingomonas sp. 67-41]|nr:class I SAM-dependent methyltransferase [Sphingomonas sp.]OJY48043.1 MAG: hypothetical protein BGP17_02535 [Sphingomonas sp. 67-41]